MAKKHGGDDEDRYVVPNKERGGWDVVSETSGRTLLHADTQDEAIRRAREIVRNSHQIGDLRFEGTNSRLGDASSTPRPVGVYRSPNSRLRRAPARQYQLRMYLGTSDPADAVRAAFAFLELARQLGYTGFRSVEISSGSLWTVFKAKVQRGWDDYRSKRAANLARQTIEAWAVDRPLSKNAKQKMEGAASFLASVSDADSVAADFGNLLIAQTRDAEGKKHVRVAAYDARDLAARKYPNEVLRDPMRLFDELPPSDPRPEEEDAPDQPE
ncbi:MAG: DUF2188 domain-containing protein [Leifsonia sp.]